MLVVTLHRFSLSQWVMIPGVSNFGIVIVGFMPSYLTVQGVGLFTFLFFTGSPELTAITIIAVARKACLMKFLLKLQGFEISLR